jgi:hypothetical protein
MIRPFGSVAAVIQLTILADRGEESHKYTGIALDLGCLAQASDIKGGHTIPF